VKRLLKSIFGASNKEVNGIIVLVVIFLLSMVYPTVHRLFSTGMQPLTEQDTQALDSLITLLSVDEDPSRDFEKFAFNPNTASAETLAKLGFDSRSAKQIINYRRSGGAFQVKKDLLKIYSIDTTLVQSLYAFIQLPAVKKTTLRSGPKSSPKATSWSQPPEVKPKVFEKFDLNLADTAMLQTISGIGSVLSVRIISFRDKLGGFAKPEQLYDVYNLDSTAVEKLLQVAYLTDSTMVKRLAINFLLEEELAKHPYISSKQARLIVAYRNQHGKFTTKQDLLKVYLVDESDVTRLQPYLLFD
jgi:competence protein ComEA